MICIFFLYAMCCLYLEIRFRSKEQLLFFQVKFDVF